MLKKNTSIILFFLLCQTMIFFSSTREEKKQQLRKIKKNMSMKNSKNSSTVPNYPMPPPKSIFLITKLSFSNVMKYTGNTNHKKDYCYSSTNL